MVKDELISKSNCHQLVLFWLSIIAVTTWLIVGILVGHTIYCNSYDCNELEAFIRKVIGTEEISIRLSPGGKPAGAGFSLSKKETQL